MEISTDADFVIYLIKTLAVPVGVMITIWLLTIFKIVND